MRSLLILLVVGMAVTPCWARSIKRLNGLCNSIPIRGDFNQKRLEKLKDLYRALEIPETRFHDVVLENPGIDLIDVSRIFPLFRLDENDPRNYNFEPTDRYLAQAREFGGELEFKFGELIEHEKVQYRVRPPQDIEKWARICLNIARHYNSGWANGFRWNIRRFSVWEEPDNDRLLTDAKKGNYEKCYFKMYASVVRKLKAEWPDVQVGGPHTMSAGKTFEAFVRYCATENLPLDFAAYTSYLSNPKAFVKVACSARKILDECGFDKTEIEISEWHSKPVIWDFNDPRYGSSIAGPFSAAYSAAVLTLGQDAPIDRMFYYAAHIGDWALISGTSPRPSYYVFRTFAEMAKGERLDLPANPAEGVYLLASSGAAGDGLMMVSLLDVKDGDCFVPIPSGSCVQDVRVVAGAADTVKACPPWRVENGRLALRAVGGSMVYRVSLSGVSAGDGEDNSATVPRLSFEIRDPFVFVENGKYWLYESKPWYGGRGVDVRTSVDLENWSQKKRVMDVPAEVPCIAVWAPEVHKFNDKYYLFATITQRRGTLEIKAMSEGVEEAKLKPRGTWIFRAESPDGPFLPVKSGPIPPEEHMTLDGTLLVEDGIPYMVYCHEWVQVGNGTIEYAPLSEDFTAFTEKPKVLLDARSALPGARQITDGPFFYRSKKSCRLYMIWSNQIEGNGYCVLIRSSPSGKLAGPWTADSALFSKDGGHGMVFHDLAGQLFLTLHQPNSSPFERMRLYPLSDDGINLNLAETPKR